ncbi:MAG: hypothetical protein V1850_02145 [Candidatus Bathyarchaeota archaeon]
MPGQVSFWRLAYSGKPSGDGMKRIKTSGEWVTPFENKFKNRKDIEIHQKIDARLRAPMQRLK